MPPPLESSTPVLRRADRLRTSLIPSLLEARRNNEAIGNQRIELFEIARIYLPVKDGLPDEQLMLGITSGGDFLAAKGMVEAIIARLNPAQASKWPISSTRCSNRAGPAN